MTRLRSDEESLTDERPIILDPLHKMGKYWSESLSLTVGTSYLKHGTHSVYCAKYDQDIETREVQATQWCAHLQEIESARQSPMHGEA